jgi:hypothetical protein
VLALVRSLFINTSFSSIRIGPNRVFVPGKPFQLSEM